MSLGILFLIFIILIVVGIPIGMVLAITGFLPNIFDSMFPVDPQYIIRSMINGVDSFPILAVPMFILSGNIMAKGKISEKLFNFFAYFIGNLTAGLPIATIVTCLFYGAISGSGPATTAAVGAMTIPILLITTIIIKLESPGPVVFKQFRIGKNMKKFKIYKFRSMRVHDSNKYSKYTLNNDERVTRFGKFIRKTRIDELPQLFCVLKGTMSFVGPRPEWDELVEEYEKKIPYYNLRHLIKPGITGWAQVMYPYGECVEDAKRKLEYDLYYLKHQDLILDVLTIMKTAKIVIFGKGK